jgi:hypothetical protein
MHADQRMASILCLAHVEIGHVVAVDPKGLHGRFFRKPGKERAGEAVTILTPEGRSCR